MSGSEKESTYSKQSPDYYIDMNDWEGACLAYENSETPLFGLQKKRREADLLKKGVDAANKGETLKALIYHCKLLGLNSSHIDGLRNMAVLLKRSGDYFSAERFARKCVMHHPNNSKGLNTLANILSAQGKLQEALDHYALAHEQDPLDASVIINLATQYHYCADIDRAFIYSTKAIDINSGTPSIWLDHMTHLRRSCCFERLGKVNWIKVAQWNNRKDIMHCLLQLLTRVETYEQNKTLLRLVCAWGDEQARQSESQSRTNNHLPTKTKNVIRIGFVSADFKDHSVARFIWPLFEHLKRERFELYCYSTQEAHDGWRSRFMGSASGFRNIESTAPQELKKLVLTDQIDILFDLTGFTKGSRTGAFASRLAPIQVSWLGYPGTTGLAAMDYLFCDRFLAPEDQSLIREKAIITQGTSVCFSDIAEVPITPKIPENIRGFLTIGSLNNPYKFTPATIARWSRVLTNLPSAQLLFVRREFESYYLRKHLRDEFIKNNISPDRLHFYNNRKDNRHYLDCYNEIDITLDTYPVTGGTTTTEALWMGVPVVGLMGPNIHQRVCSAILHHVGHPEWIASNDDEFVDIALCLAADQHLRQHLRKNLRNTLRNSILCNTKKFAADFADTMEKLVMPAA